MDFMDLGRSRRNLEIIEQIEGYFCQIAQFLARSMDYSIDRWKS